MGDTRNKNKISGVHISIPTNKPLDAINMKKILSDTIIIAGGLLVTIFWLSYGSLTIVVPLMATYIANLVEPISLKRAFLTSTLGWVILPWLFIEIPKIYTWSSSMEEFVINIFNPIFLVTFVAVIFGCIQPLLEEQLSKN